MKADNINISILRIRFILISFMSLFLFGGIASGMNPKDMINPNIKDRTVYVADPAGLVSQEAKDDANRVLWNLRQQTGVEVAIVVVPDTGDFTIEDFATEVFTQWGIGKNDKDNGVLILIAPVMKSARIATGYGVEGIIPDISAKKIIDRSVVPYMKNEDINGAVKAVAADVATVLSDPEAAEELKSANKESWEEMQSDITGEDILKIAGIIVLLVFFFSIGKFIYDNNRFAKQDRYRQALGWDAELNYYLLFAVLSLGLGSLPYLMARKKYKDARNKPMKCPACRGKMIKLNEEEDNNLLSPSQDFEEKLNTVDYDVWVCEDCGTVERYPFRIKQMKYQECPNCHTIAMCLVRDHTVVPATTRRPGVGEKIYECKYCHNQHKKRYQIPQKADATAAALAAGAILGSGGRGGGFGGGIGGGFGGGSTGGGGATGRW